MRIAYCAGIRLNESDVMLSDDDDETSISIDERVRVVTLQLLETLAYIDYFAARAYVMTRHSIRHRQ